MLKNKNKEMLKKIFEEEYEKALAQEKKAKLNKEIERVKARARAKAKLKAEGKLKRLQKLTSGGGGSKKYRKKAKRVGDAAIRIRDNLMDLL